MSLKEIFNNISEKVVSGNELEKIYEEVESKGLLEEKIKDSERYVPYIDFTTASNFARYGSAEKYYKDALENIYKRYPYDGSKKEKMEWRNNSSIFDIHVYDNIYPKTTGYIYISGTLNNTDGKNQYIKFFGGPNAYSNTASSMAKTFEYSNIYDPSSNRASNLALNPLNYGNTIEFWYKLKDVDSISTGRQYTIFDLWNGKSSGTSDRVRLSISFNYKNDKSLFTFNIVTKVTGNLASDVTNQINLSGSAYDITSWNHYAVSINPISNNSASAELYINGKFFTKQNIQYFDKSTDTTDFVGYIGASQTVDGRSPLNGYLDEFRFWKEARNAQEIGRNWFTSVDGGANTDDSNTELGVYYKFNEGNSGYPSLDSRVLDYSGRISNGVIYNYTGSSYNIRSTSSAINEYSSEFSEKPDPILVSIHPDVLTVVNEYSNSGSIWDQDNNSNIYKSLPSWITEEQEEKGTDDLSNLIQIISSYFDTLHIQIENLTKIKDVRYTKEDEKPLPFISNILSSYGFENVDLFNSTTLFEQILSRNDTSEYSKNINEIKNVFESLRAYADGLFSLLCSL